MKKYRLKVNKSNLKYIRKLFFITRNQKDVSSIIEKNKKLVSMIYKQINYIPDVSVRLAIKLRFVDCKLWSEVSYKMGYWSHDGSRKLLDRYFANLNK